MNRDKIVEEISLVRIHEDLETPARVIEMGLTEF